MTSRLRWSVFTALLMLGASLVLFDIYRERTIDFSGAQKLAEHRFKLLANDIGVRKSEGDFAPLVITDHGNSWEFEWRLKSGQGSFIVIVERNGEYADTVTYPISR